MELTLMNHIGILLMNLITFYLIAVFGKTDWKKEWWCPAGFSFLIFILIEVICWTMYFFS